MIILWKTIIAPMHPSVFSPLLVSRLVKLGINLTISGLDYRESGKAKMKENSISSKQVIGITKHGETHTVAEFLGTHWYLMNAQWVLHNAEVGESGHLFDLKGDRTVCIHLFSHHLYKSLMILQSFLNFSLIGI